MPPKQFSMIVNNVKAKALADRHCRLPSAEDAVRGSSGDSESANRE
jgi:hypothetical protein